MGQQLNTVSINQFTDLITRKWSIRNTFVERGIVQKLFIYTDESANTGDVRRFTDIDVETFAKIKPQGVAAAKATVQYGYEVDMTARRFAREIDITWEMRRYNKQPEVMAQITSLSHFCPNRMELDLTQRITFATATSYTDQDGISVTTTVGDGLALVSAVHTLTGSTSTYSNVITGNPVFSRGGLEIAESQTNTQIVSNFGERRVMNFNTIISSDDPNSCNEIKRFIKSTTDVDQNNPSVINVYKDKYSHVILPYLATAADGTYDSTKAKYWGLIAAGQGMAGWQAYIGIWESPNLKTPAPGNNGEDVHTDNWTYGARCSYGIATVTGKGFMLSTGLGV